jgi:hypothetical protein
MLIVRLQEVSPRLFNADQKHNPQNIGFIRFAGFKNSLVEEVFLGLRNND